MRRFFLPPEKFNGHEIALEGDVYHHLKNVLRLAPGETIQLLDGTGTVRQCRVEYGERGKLKAVVLNQWREEEFIFPVHLIQALPKAEKMDWILQKCTECGVGKFSPVMTKRSVPFLSGERKNKRLQRWQRIVAEACRQCGRPSIPVVCEPRELAEVLSFCREENRFFCRQVENRSLASVIEKKRPADAAVLVGPEGGFEEDEIALIEKCGFETVGLGPRVLRTETAGFAMAAILQYLYGDMGNPGG